MSAAPLKWELTLDLAGVHFLQGMSHFCAAVVMCDSETSCVFCCLSDDCVPRLELTITACLDRQVIWFPDSSISHRPVAETTRERWCRWKGGRGGICHLLLCAFNNSIWSSGKIEDIKERRNATHLVVIPLRHNKILMNTHSQYMRK